MPSENKDVLILLISVHDFRSQINIIYMLPIPMIFYNEGTAAYLNIVR